MSIVSSYISSRAPAFRINVQASSFMDHIFAITFGLSLRVVIDAVSHQDNRLTGTLVGLWEGVVLQHFLKKMPNSFDPYVAYGVRIFVDFLFTESLKRLILTLIWSGMGIVLADIAPAIWFDVGLHRYWRRFRRDLYLITQSIPAIPWFAKPRTVRFSPSRSPGGITEAPSVVTNTTQAPVVEVPAPRPVASIPATRRRFVPGSFPGDASETETDLGSALGLRSPGSDTSLLPGTSHHRSSSNIRRATVESESELTSDLDDGNISSSGSSYTNTPTVNMNEAEMPIIEDEEDVDTEREVILDKGKDKDNETTPRQKPMAFPPTPSDSAFALNHLSEEPIEAPPLSADVPHIPDDDDWENITRGDLHTPPPAEPEYSATPPTLPPKDELPAKETLAIPSLPEQLVTSTSGKGYQTKEASNSPPEAIGVAHDLTSSSTAPENQQPAPTPTPAPKKSKATTPESEKPTSTSTSTEPEKPTSTSTSAEPSKPTSTSTLAEQENPPSTSTLAEPENPPSASTPAVPEKSAIDPIRQPKNLEPDSSSNSRLLGKESVYPAIQPIKYRQPSTSHTRRISDPPAWPVPQQTLLSETNPVLKSGVASKVVTPTSATESRATSIAWGAKAVTPAAAAKPTAPLGGLDAKKITPQFLSTSSIWDANKTTPTPALTLTSTTPSTPPATTTTSTQQIEDMDYSLVDLPNQKGNAPPYQSSLGRPFESESTSQPAQTQTSGIALKPFNFMTTRTQTSGNAPRISDLLDLGTEHWGSNTDANPSSNTPVTGQPQSGEERPTAKSSRGSADQPAPAELPTLVSGKVGLSADDAKDTSGTPTSDAVVEPTVDDEPFPESVGGQVVRALELRKQIVKVEGANEELKQQCRADWDADEYDAAVAKQLLVDEGEKKLLKLNEKAERWYIAACSGNVPEKPTASEIDVSDLEVAELQDHVHKTLAFLLLKNQPALKVTIASSSKKAGFKGKTQRPALNTLTEDLGLKSETDIKNSRETLIKLPSTPVPILQ